jgi:hypothetical protein
MSQPDPSTARNGPTVVRRRRTPVMSAVGAITRGLLALATAPAGASPHRSASPAVAALTSQAATAAACERNSPPSWFYTELSRAARVPGDRVPSSWGNATQLSADLGNQAWRRLRTGSERV